MRRLRKKKHATKKKQFQCDELCIALERLSRKKKKNEKKERKKGIKKERTRRKREGERQRRKQKAKKLEISRCALARRLPGGTERARAKKNHAKRGDQSRRR